MAPERACTTSGWPDDVKSSTTEYVTGSFVVIEFETLFLTSTSPARRRLGGCEVRRETRGAIGSLGLSSRGEGERQEQEEGRKVSCAKIC